MENTPPELHVDRHSPHAAICLKPYPGEIVCDIDRTGDSAESDARRLASSWNALRHVPLDVLENRPEAATRPFHVLASCMYALHEMEAGRTDLALAALKEAIKAA